MALNFQQTRDLLYDFHFQDLFIEQLGWEQPTQTKTFPVEIENQTYESKRIAEISGVAVFEVKAINGEIPSSKIRDAIHKEITSLVAENLLIFVDNKRTRSLWYWVKREENKSYIRDHLYVKGQPGDLFLSKLGSLVIDITELEDDTLSVVEIAHRLKEAFDVERVTKKFYKEFQEQHREFLGYVKGINNQTDKRWYTSVILNRLMFVYFLQRKGFIDNRDTNYLQNKLDNSKQRGENLFYQEFLQALFFESFAKPETDRDKSVESLVGKIKYLNGGLFLKHRIEQEYEISIADEAFEKVLNLFARYSWNLDDTPEGKDNEINPDILGYIFEKYINQKEKGAYYTRPQITEYLCDRTINKLIVDRVNTALPDNYEPFEDVKDLLRKPDGNVCRLLVEDILPNLSILDPACGSGAFLIAALKTLISVYSAAIGTIKFYGDARIKQWLKKIESDHKSLLYYIKKRIITDNLYGVDIMEEATEIAKLRLFLALVASVDTVDELEPLPNIDFNIMAGNSLIGLIKVDETAFDSVGESKQGNLLQPLKADNYKKILEDKNQSIELYKKHAFIPGKEKLTGSDEGTEQDARLLNLRGHIEKLNQESQQKLNLLLLDEFSQRLGIKYEEVQLNGKKKKRVLKIDDITGLKPFHWGYHFDKILERGGFDAIITNPPWEVFQTNEKEFFQSFVTSIKKNKIRIEEWETQRDELLKLPEVKKQLLTYESSFPHQLAYFKRASQYSNQTTIINGKSIGNKPNFYSLFVEQCFNLLRSSGKCGMVVPSGIYSDIGTKQLREMLFNQTQVTGLFGFENRKLIFEGVHRSFKIVVLTFEKSGNTEFFPTAFMRQEVQELTRFPNAESLNIRVDIARRYSPDSLSLIEFKNQTELDIASKLLDFPLLADSNSGWGIELYGEELNMTRSSSYFKTTSTSFPVYEGRMIWHFEHNYGEARYWVQESNLRDVFLKKRTKRIKLLKDVPEDMQNDYEAYRIAIRKIGRNTDTRTLISTIIPRYAFAGNSLSVNFPFHHDKERYNELRLSNKQLLVLDALLNSFVSDYVLRSRMNTNLNLFYLYQLPMPRLHHGDRNFTEILQRAAKLICTTPEFDELAQDVGLGSHKNGITNETQRAQLRAELDGIIAHLYGLTEEEFKYILTTFPIVPEETKQAALEAYRTFTPMSGDAEIISLIEQGENDQIEFKSTARWNLRENKKDKEIEHEIVKAVAAFLNTNGGTLLIGIDDDGVPLGLNHDYQTLKKKNNDGYMLFLNNDLLLREIGKQFGTFFRITFHQVSGQDVCRVVVQPSPKPIYVKHKDKNGKEEEIFYIRSNNSSVKLSTKQAVEYSRSRWG